MGTNVWRHTPEERQKKPAGQDARLHQNQSRNRVSQIVFGNRVAHVFWVCGGGGGPRTPQEKVRRIARDPHLVGTGTEAEQRKVGITKKKALEIVELFEKYDKDGDDDLGTYYVRTWNPSCNTHIRKFGVKSKVRVRLASVRDLVLWLRN